MKPSSKQVRALVNQQRDGLREMRFAFMVQHVPRLHRLVMEAFPGFRDWFSYSIAENDDDPTKLTLLRGKGKKTKVIARNFHVNN